jgi:hypothetical protein
LITWDTNPTNPSQIWIGHELACTFRDIPTNKEDDEHMESAACAPIVLISTGRAGSSVTWDTVSRLVGGRANVAFEYTGGNRTKSQIFFDSIDPRVGHQWASLHLCQIQAEERVQGSGICGFQWKPYFNTFKHHPYARAALEEMAQRKHPPIRFIFLTRNALDRAISNIKHKGHVRSPDLPAHCAVHDTECRDKHARLGTGVHLPTDDLIHHLKEAEKKDDFIEQTLIDVGAQYVRVSFERLYDQENIQEWKKILYFLQKGPADTLTMQQVHDAFAIQRTSTRSHQDILSNYEQVKQVLQGTPFESLLT